MERTVKCPKCQQDMDQGFLPDFTYGGNVVTRWVEGQPKKSFWIGTKVRSGEGISIGAFRCRKCGYIELYADSTFSAK